MIKEYVQCDASEAQLDELDFVERYWTEKFEEVLPQVSLEAIRSRDEYIAMLPYLKSLPAGATIIDGGCGRGEWTITLSRDGYNVIGLDVSETLIGRLKASHPEQVFVRGDLRETGLQSASVDMLFSWGAFEHFEVGLKPCLRESMRVLKPGGWLLITVPYANTRIQKTHESKLEIFEAPEGKISRFYQYRFTSGELRRDLAANGFLIDHVKPICKVFGVTRLMRNNWGLRLSSGSRIEQYASAMLAKIIPQNYVAHMLFAAARKN